MRNLPTVLDEYRDTPQAEESIERYGDERIEQLLADAETVAQASDAFVAVHDGQLGAVIRTDEKPVLERIYEDSYPNIDSFETSYHCKRRAKERGFFEEELYDIVRTGVQSVDEHDNEYGVLVFNKFWDNTVLVPVSTDGTIKSVFTRQGVDGGLVVNDRELDRSTRSYLERKGKIAKNAKYQPSIE